MGKLWVGLVCLFVACVTASPGTEESDGGLVRVGKYRGSYSVQYASSYLGSGYVGSADGILVVMTGQSNALSHALASTAIGSNTQYTAAYPNIQTIQHQEATFGDDPMVYQDYTGSLSQVSFDLET